MYDGPDSVKPKIISVLNDLGILVGDGIPVFVFVKPDEESDLVAVWISAKGKEYDNFENLCTSEDLKSFLRDVFFKIFGEHEKPEYGFVISLENGKFHLRLDKTRIPVVFRRKPGRYFLKVNDEVLEVEEDFRKIDDTTVYVGRDIELETHLTSFYRGVDMIYPDGSILVGSVLKLPNGEKITVESTPISVLNGTVVFRNSIRFKNGSTSKFKETIVAFEKGVLLLSNGEVSDINGRWRIKVSCPPLEWAFRGNEIYILDLCGYLKVFDLKRKKVIRSERYVGAYGFDFLKGSLVIGYGNEISYEGKKIKAKDFCVARGKLITFNGEKRVERTHKGYCLIVQDGNLRILGTDFESGYEGIMIFDDFISVSSSEGVWVVKFPRRD